MFFENTSVYNFKNALRGMRNPLNSWDKSDTIEDEKTLHIGPNDYALVMKLIAAGSEYRKFLQQIFVSVDITAPRYWWQEMDTYRVGIVKNSCSTMHTIHHRLLTKEDFTYCDDDLLAIVNKYIEIYQKDKSSKNLRRLKSILPEGFLQKRTVTLNYENLLNIYLQRRNHRLKEWQEEFMEWAFYLPYFKYFAKAVLQSKNLGFKI